eukprot:TRINITY_DN14967_c2_g1_i2.p1 TRINITY_DN14967_c2_g1~~TRINITY_DN14967_c2_g1_i2.p1  ORF type:complete len:172 (+),score=12.73 TRINITY_DN14967_c2_g1_i2:6-521(+)
MAAWQRGSAAVRQCVKWTQVAVDQVASGSVGSSGGGNHRSGGAGARGDGAGPSSSTSSASGRRSLASPSPLRACPPPSSTYRDLPSSQSVVGSTQSTTPSHRPLEDNASDQQRIWSSDLTNLSVADLQASLFTLEEALEERLAQVQSEYNARKAEIVRLVRAGRDGNARRR